MRAAMARLRKKIGAARAAISECDEWTKPRIELARRRAYDQQPHSARDPFLSVEFLEDQLAKFERAIDAAKAALDAIVRPQPGVRARYLASQLRLAFEVFGVPFNRTKHSPAKETLLVILNFVTPTGLDAVDHYIRWAEKFGE
jgi:hypothetical protein